MKNIFSANIENSRRKSFHGLRPVSSSFKQGTAHILIASLVIVALCTAQEAVAATSHSKKHHGTAAQAKPASSSGHHSRTAHTSAHTISQTVSHTGSHRHHSAVHTEEVSAHGSRTAHKKHSEEKHLVETVTVDRHGRKHRHTVAVSDSETTTKIKIIRDRRGRIIRREKITVAKHGTHEPLQSEEHSINAKEKVHSEKAAAEVQAESAELPSEYHDFGKAYALYDEGINARMSGNCAAAVSNISRALDMVPSNAHGGRSVLALNMEYDLAQAAESAGDLTLAARYYARAIADRPNFPDANVRLVKVLARSGKIDEALRVARDGISRNPNDARAHAVLSLLLTKTGADTEAQVERRKANALVTSTSTRAYVQPTPGTPPSFENRAQSNSADTSGGINQLNNPNQNNPNNPAESDAEGFMP